MSEPKASESMYQRLLDPPQLEEPAEGPPPSVDGSGDDGGLTRWQRLTRQAVEPEFLVTLLVVTACSVFTFAELQPSQLFANTTPTGGDMGAHVWLPWYVENDLLPNLRITGWTMDWYAGFPALTYYFPLPMVAIVVLNAVLPYNIAFKLVTASGLIALPIAAWAFGRLARLPFPGPACLAAATLPYLFSEQFTIYGGNIASTMAGEFSFSIALSIALVFLGLVARGMETGRYRVLAAVLLCCSALCHVLPTFFAIGGTLVLLAMHALRGDRGRWRWALPVLVVAGLLSAFWSLAFEFRLPYATNMGYQKLTSYLPNLFPAKFTWLFIIAGMGALLSVTRRRRVGTFLTVMTVLAALVFRFAPQARLWNARVIPFWYLCLYLLAGLAFYEIGVMVAEGLRRNPRTDRVALLPVPVITLLVALVWVGYPLRVLPGGHTTAAGRYDWLGITSASSSFVPDWVKWNYSGYQGADKSRRVEYFDLVNTMKQIGATDGCGRAMWEYEPELNDMGTPDALMLLPYWTNSCIGSMEGLYYESSATTPYHFLNAAELSEQPSNPVRGLTYPSTPDVSEGVHHLQMFGVRYYMAISPETQAQANADPDLRLLRRLGPFLVSDTDNGNGPVQPRYWNIYQVQHSTLVTPLANQPVVMRGVSGGNTAWLDPSVAWYTDPARWSVYETASGPTSWARVDAGDSNPPSKPLPPVQVTDVKVHEESMSFNVDRTGVPVLVNTSYFPNWQVSGGKGPYRATPNLMVVIPTSHHVELDYGYTALDYTGYVFSFLGLVGLVLLWRIGPARYPRRRSKAGVEEPPSADDHGS